MEFKTEPLHSGVCTRGSPVLMRILRKLWAIKISETLAFSLQNFVPLLATRGMLEVGFHFEEVTSSLQKSLKSSLYNLSINLSIFSL
jgi:hypothetical protein